MCRCAFIDNQIRVQTPCPGLAHWQPGDTPAWKPENWRSWPHLFLPMDMGADGWKGSFALMYLYRLNVLRFPDFDHMCQMAMIETLKGSDVYDMWLLMAVSWIFVCGP